MILFLQAVAYNQIYLQVVKLSKLDDHTCPSSETVKGHQASTAWISQRAKQIIEEDPTLSAKKLQRRLEKHYNIELSYFKVRSRKNQQWMIFMALGRRVS